MDQPVPYETRMLWQLREMQQVNCHSQLPQTWQTVVRTHLEPSTWLFYLGSLTKAYRNLMRVSVCVCVCSSEKASTACAYGSAHPCKVSARWKWTHWFLSLNSVGIDMSMPFARFWKDCTYHWRLQVASRIHYLVRRHDLCQSLVERAIKQCAQCWYVVGYPVGQFED